MSNNVYANEADALEMSRLRLSGRCTRCTEYADHCECPPLPRTRATNHNPFEPADVVVDNARDRLTEDDE